MPLKTYSLENCLLAIGGQQVKGYGDGESIVWSWSEEDWAVVQGTHGEVARAQKPNAVVTLKIRLLQGNPVNRYLAEKRQADVAGETRGQGTFDVVFKDHSSDTQIRAQKAWVSKIPDLSFGTEPGVREWEITCVDVDLQLGELTE